MEYFFKPGDRIELSPATDMWMRGARFGTIVAELTPRFHYHPRRVRVKLDKFKHPLTLRKSDVNPIDPPAGQALPKSLTENS